MTNNSAPLSSFPPVAFIGGGNMASAIIGGLVSRGLPIDRIDVVEPFAETRASLQSQFNIIALEKPNSQIARAQIVVWAVKPQAFKEAAQQVAPHTRSALHLSVAAGIRTDSIAQWLGCQGVVRAMPNTPALIGQGMTGLFARTTVAASERELVEEVVSTVGAHMWVGRESQLDIVTAISGSGPAYVFYFLESMVKTGMEMGLTREQAHQLATNTFAGASELARRSNEEPSVLRQRVTSKGGTTHAAIQSMESDGMSMAFARALHAAKDRARELGDEFCATS